MKTLATIAALLSSCVIPAQAFTMSDLNGVLVLLAYDGKCRKVLSNDSLEVLGRMTMTFKQSEIAFALGRVQSLRNKPQFCSEMAPTIEPQIEELNNNTATIMQDSR